MSRSEGFHFQDEYSTFKRDQAQISTKYDQIPLYNPTGTKNINNQDNYENIYGNTASPTREYSEYNTRRNIEARKDDDIRTVSTLQREEIEESKRKFDTVMPK